MCAEIETRVRVDAYSHVRAIAEASDGQLYAVTRFVKASGGCSAPAGSDAQAAAARSISASCITITGPLPPSSIARRLIPAARQIASPTRAPPVKLIIATSA
mgnify:CR=1 FL=1